MKVKTLAAPSVGGPSCLPAVSCGITVVNGAWEIGPGETDGDRGAGGNSGSFHLKPGSMWLI